MTPLERGTLVLGTFSPLRTDTLKPAARPFIGLEGVFEALWHDFEGPYPGSWRMRVPREWDAQIRGQRLILRAQGLSEMESVFLWVPDIELSDARRLRNDEVQAYRALWRDYY